MPALFVVLALEALAKCSPIGLNTAKSDLKKTDSKSFVTAFRFLKVFHQHEIRTPVLLRFQMAVVNVPSLAQPAQLLVPPGRRCPFRTKSSATNPIGPV